MSESQHLLKQQGDNIEIIEEQQPINYGSLHQQQQQTPSVKFKIEKNEKNKISPIFISWHNLTIKHPKSGRIILDNVSGMAKSGQLVALMGARLILFYFEFSEGFFVQ
ncbi:unnamed protein product [Meloidogyne enterolobii]|uniref:Uncharacterized protein n=1 Tax=Meloidogyne enterolobii TaxID=390850 RepID=A0ACB1A4U1_MELEN